MRLPARGMGREGRHRHELGAPHLAPARRSCRSAGRSTSPTGGSLSQVAQRSATARPSPIARRRRYFDEHARLSGFENDGSRAFDISRPRRHLGDEAFDALAPFQWPLRAGEGTHRAPFRATAASSRRPAGPLRGHRRAPPGSATCLARHGRSFSTPAASATSGTP